jgi:hypothetical protein
VGQPLKLLFCADKRLEVVLLSHMSFDLSESNFQFVLPIFKGGIPGAGVVKKNSVLVGVQMGVTGGVILFLFLIYFALASQRKQREMEKEKLEKETELLISSIIPIEEEDEEGEGENQSYDSEDGQKSESQLMEDGFFNFLSSALPIAPERIFTTVFPEEKKNSLSAVGGQSVAFERPNRISNGSSSSPSSSSSSSSSSDKEEVDSLQLSLSSDILLPHDIVEGIPNLVVVSTVGNPVSPQSKNQPPAVSRKTVDDDDDDFDDDLSATDSGDDWKDALLSSEDENDEKSHMLEEEEERVKNCRRPLLNPNFIKEDENDHSSMALSSETNELLSSLDSTNSLFHLDDDNDDDNDD